MLDFDLVDTTLRDGEQTAGVAFSFNDKLRILNAMEETGIRWIEAGIPAMGEEEQFLLREMLARKGNTNLIAWNRAVTEDVMASLDCGFSFIHISVPISDINIRYKLNKDRDWVFSRLENMLKLIHSYGASILIGAEDASRADQDYFLKIADLGYRYGAIRIRYADTVGCLNPFTVKKNLDYLVKRCPLPIEFHGHNDFGLAAANSLAAYRSGVAFVSATVTGIGERAGNACLEELVLALDKLYGYDLNMSAVPMKKLTRLVEHASGHKIYGYRPAIGKMGKGVDGYGNSSCNGRTG